MTPEQLSALAPSQPAVLQQLPHSPAQGAAPGADIEQLLQGLADIHLPQAISWWPPAPGWWIGMMILMILLFFSVRYLRRYLRNRKLRQVILYELDAIRRQWIKQDNLFVTSSKLSVFLRRVALQIEPRNKVASLQNEQWMQFLGKQKGLEHIERYQHLLQQYAYQDPLISLDMNEKRQQSELLEHLFRDITVWINKEVHNV